MIIAYLIFTLGVELQGIKAQLRYRNAMIEEQNKLLKKP
jgi:hypothetical protein